ncbi:uncharacterized protein LOC142354228 [Convolutriloba macropyga]|uniref:uncharacterized protein LOC142354228 n=1 Tax=Convolutriloba macropyga TaxID=536237 RepID=UPI003F526A5A
MRPKEFDTEDACNSQVCSGGTCHNINDPPFFNCICFLGYYGQACEDYNPCVNMPCLPYECINVTTNQFECVCPNGAKYTDVSDCDELEKDPCKNEPCENDGVCINEDEAGSFSCDCKEGFKGKRCEQRDNCYYIKCQNGGKCVDDDVMGSRCECPPNTGGMYCEEAGPCERFLCSNEGQCYIDEQSGEPMCKCTSGWYGDRCEFLDPCDPSRNPCQNGATCESSAASQEAVCRCAKEYYGAFCQHFDACAQAEKCNGHGACKIDSNSPNLFTCDCDDGWTGQFCQDQNLCIAGKPCNHGGECTYLGHNNYSCTCVDQSGFWGPNCQYYDQCHNAPCQNGGVCRNITSDNNNENDYTCLCDNPFRGHNCEIYDPCRKPDYCGRGTCNFLSDGEAKCICSPGYYGNQCENYDVCKVRNPCQNGGKCDATADNGYKCTCINGYSGPDCDKFDPCVGKPCLNGGICVTRDDRLGIYECQCKDGVASGVRCEYINPCMKPQQCPNKFVCLNTSTEHALCRPGDSSGIPMGSACTSDGDCLNGGTCTNQGLCQCVTPYEGNRCENINPCNEPMICSQHGECRRESSVNAKCTCDPGYFGAKCQYEDPCLTKKCFNGGNCVLLDTATPSSKPDDRPQLTPKCHCREGYQAKEDCSEANKECSTNLCYNGGRCLTLGYVSPLHQDGYVCECPDEFFGSKCQHLRTCAPTSPLDMKSIGALRWPETPAGNVSKIVCPYGSRTKGGYEAINNGFATRPCVITKSNHHIDVAWGDINSKLCQNEPKTLVDAKRIINEMVKTLATLVQSGVTVDTIRYCSQVLHNLLAAFTITDRDSAQKHVTLINNLMTAPAEIILAAEGNFSTSTT